MSQFSQNILKKIKKEKQIPAWHFFLRNIFFWLMFLLALTLGAIAFGFILLSLFRLDLEPFITPGISRWQYIATVLPLLWILFLVAFSFLAYLGLHQTRRGYRFSLPLIIGGNILGSIVLGLGFYTIGAPHWIEKHTTLRSHHQAEEQKVWSQPEKGFLSGTVQTIEVCQKNKKILCSMVIVDFQKKKWNINIENIPLPFRKKMKEREIEGRRIKITGSIVNNNTFSAKRIMPFFRPPLFMRKDAMDFQQNFPSQRREKNPPFIPENTSPPEVLRPLP